MFIGNQQMLILALGHSPEVMRCANAIQHVVRQRLMAASFKGKMIAFTYLIPLETSSYLVPVHYNAYARFFGQIQSGVSYQIISIWQINQPKPHTWLQGRNHGFVHCVLFM